MRGVIIDGGATDNTIGGTAAAARNIISGNGEDGVAIYNPGTDGNVVEGDYLGTDVTGKVGLGNTWRGVVIFDDAQDNTVGGTVLGAGNVLSDDGTGGVWINDAQSDVVQGNIIGLDESGTVALGNLYAGVQIDGGSSGNVVGGSFAAARNIISSNTDYGVLLNTGATGNLVQGNYIGTDATGAIARGNSLYGILIIGGSVNNTVGGTTAGAGNVISGNAEKGIIIGATGTTGNVVEGNDIGTNASGTAALANAWYGVEVYSPGNIIGGSVAGAGNVISGNGIYGVLLDSSGGSTLVEGNTVGLNAAGTAAVANGGDGIEINAGGNTIGGTTAAARNVISGNTGDGIDIDGAGATNNLIEGDYIGTDATGTVALADAVRRLHRGWRIGQHDRRDDGHARHRRGDVISGNAVHGLQISGAADNTVEGDLIGTNAAGTAALPNTYEGVELFSAGAGNTIGGTAAGAANVISGDTIGIEIVGTGGEVIEGDFIGTNAAGTVALANSYSGIRLYGTSQNTIGGTTAAARNIISGNAVYGIILLDANNYFGVTGPSDQNVIEGDYIGVAAGGTAALGNNSEGVNIQGISAGNTVGGTAAGAGNVISGNSQAGIVVSGTQNLIAGNKVGTNAAGTAALANIGDGIDVYANANTIGGTAAAAAQRDLGQRLHRDRDRRGYRQPRRRATSSAPTPPARPVCATSATASPWSVPRATRSAARPPAPAT